MGGLSIETKLHGNRHTTFVGVRLQPNAISFYFLRNGTCLDGATLFQQPENNYRHTLTHKKEEEKMTLPKQNNLLLVSAR